MTEEWVLECLKIAEQEARAMCRRYRGMNESDLLSYCSIVITKHYQEITEPALMRAYLKGAMRNHIKLSRLRGQREDEAAATMYRCAGHPENVDDVAFQQYRTIANALLTPHQDVVYVLSHIGGFTVREIGEQIGLHHDTVHFHLRRAEKIIEKFFAQHPTKAPRNYITV
jgi:RNA polymerase sigma factor (sigma-70 family)